MTLGDPLASTLLVGAVGLAGFAAAEVLVPRLVEDGTPSRPLLFRLTGHVSPDVARLAVRAERESAHVLGYDDVAIVAFPVGPVDTETEVFEVARDQWDAVDGRVDREPVDAARRAMQTHEAVSRSTRSVTLDASNAIVAEALDSIEVDDDELDQDRGGSA